MNELMTVPNHQPIHSVQNWIHSKDQCEHMVKLATNLFSSGILPKFVRSPQVAFAMMVKAHAFSLPEECAWDYFYENPYNQQIELKTTTKVALIAKAGGVIRTVENTNEKVTVECYRPNWGTEVFSFSFEEAQKAGLVQRNQVYNKYTRDMLWARAISRASSRMFPDIILGIDANDSVEFTADVASGAGNERDKQAVLSSKQIIEKITNEAKEEVSHGNQTPQAEHQSHHTVEDSGTQKESSIEKSEAPASESAAGSEPTVKPSRGRRQKQPDAPRFASADLAPGVEPASSGAETRERPVADQHAAQPSSDDVAHATKSDRIVGIPDGPSGSGSEGQVRQHEAPLSDNISENPQFQDLRSKIETGFPGATVRGRRLGSFEPGNPDHMKMISFAARELMLSTEFKKNHGKTIVDFVENADVDANQAAVTAAVRKVIDTLVEF